MRKRRHRRRVWLSGSTDFTFPKRRKVRHTDTTTTTTTKRIPLSLFENAPIRRLLVGSLFSLSLSLSLSLFFLFLILFHRILFLLLAAVWLMLLASAGYLSAFFFRKREPTSTSPLPTLNSPLFSVTQVKRFVFSRRRLRHSFHFS